MATPNKLRSLNRLPFDFVDGLKIKGTDVTDLMFLFSDQGASLVGKNGGGSVQDKLDEIDGQENTVTGQFSLSISGYRNEITGTATACSGRNNDVSGNDCFVAGDGNTSSGNWTTAFGYKNTISHDHSHVRGGYNGITSWSGQDVRWSYRNLEAPLTPARQHFYLDLSDNTATTAASQLKLLNGSALIGIPELSIWKCKLQVVAMSSGIKGASFDISFTIQRGASSTVFLGTIDTVSKLDSGLGTASNAASASVALSGNNLVVNIQPRLDTALSIKWAGTLEVLEVR
jgi:hypothetical protein